MISFRKISLLLITTGFLGACSNGMKLRQEMRTKVSKESGMFCDFVNGDDHKDVEVELNLQMAKKCDAVKSFTISQYKSSSDVNGMIYCCAMSAERKALDAKPEVAKAKPVEAKPVEAKPAAEVKAPTEEKAIEAAEVKPAAQAPAPVSNLPAKAKPAAKSTAKPAAKPAANANDDILE